MTHVLYYAKAFIATPYNEKKITAPTKVEWEGEVKRFIDTLNEISYVVEQNHLLLQDYKILLQGPLADIMTHICQLAMLIRASGSPISPENFMKAKI